MWNDIKRWLSKTFSIGTDTAESIIIGVAIGMFLLFIVPGVGVIIASVTGSVLGMGSLLRRRDNLKKQPPADF